MPNAYSRALKAHDNNQEGIRLQKILAQAGFGS
ncbi:MAG: pseudouridine synthase, partial [Bifidobacterium sp.]|nr:pseudouridine synthase [Bifidobacterium sp.]